MTVSYDTNPSFKNALTIRQSSSNSSANSGLEASKSNDFTGHVRLEKIQKIQV